VYPFQETVSSPTNKIKARTKLPSMPFPYLVTLLILLPFVLFPRFGLRPHAQWIRLWLIFREINLWPISCPL
jgi:hypothetical protein